MASAQDLLEQLMESGDVIWYDENGNPVRNEEEGEEDIPSNNEWIETPEGHFFPAKDTKIRKKLPPGMFIVNVQQGKYFLSKDTINTDELYRMPNDGIESILAENDKFWKKADLFEEKGIAHKRGMMLHGSPGCGKTSTINILAQDVVKRGGLVFRIKTTNDLKALINFIHGYLRDIEPETPIIVIVENIDKLVDQDESLVLEWLSGDDEFNHCVVIATTNRFQECNDLLLRPSRFDYFLEMDNSSKDERSFYLSKKGINDELLEKWISATQGFTMAQLKELYIAVELLDNDFDQSIKRLKDQERDVKLFANKTIKTTIGFGAKK